MLDSLLQKMVDTNASDLFVTAGFPVSAKINGKLTPVTESATSEEASLALVHEAMTEKQQNEFHTTKECNFAIVREGIGRFLVLFVGGTGTGKSTSLAALIGHRNENSHGHILTIEDPIEFVHEHKNCVITQREVGIDTQSFDDALKSSLRQAPDVILIGEIRSMETMEYAMSFADTGHLCVATLHANNANQAIERIMHLAPKFEVLKNKIEDSGMSKEAMKKGKEQGMQSFDMALYDLYKAGKIDMDQALHHADSPNDLRLMIKLDTSDGSSLGTLSNVSIDMDD